MLPPAGISGVINDRVAQSAYQVDPELLRDALHRVGQLADASGIDSATRQAMRDLITRPLHRSERADQISNVVRDRRVGARLWFVAVHFSARLHEHGTEFVGAELRS